MGTRTEKCSTVGRREFEDQREAAGAGEADCREEGVHYEPACTRVGTASRRWCGPHSWHHQNCEPGLKHSIIWSPALKWGAWGYQCNRLSPKPSCWRPNSPHEHHVPTRFHTTEDYLRCEEDYLRCEEDNLRCDKTTWVLFSCRHIVSTS